MATCTLTSGLCNGIQVIVPRVSVSQKSSSKNAANFTNFVEMNDIKSLAEADEFECVRVGQEYYADYLATYPHLYSLNISNTYQQNYEWNDNLLRRTVQGFVSVLLSLR
ncbi:unnamed protein product [Rotaria socialis]|uniref:Uncharacterized protein n=3 Tax=Rotaria TaxID=231623 RepID=A0A816XEC4_9BILA|nr:unnamed protein product [Rotaria magnacalcarata]CAF3087061.1 unnamed protein product [Rotaria socialis]CAF1680513.1 unnamed protein product [Rotaria magnacalcarata]CAF2069238.1 unnamed protein product [Rotaria magnacalcarata]CAF2091011.1 unnamed protein product [Rotaria magnacalcarata]